MKAVENNIDGCNADYLIQYRALFQNLFGEQGYFLKQCEQLKNKWYGFIYSKAIRVVQENVKANAGAYFDFERNTRITIGVDGQQVDLSSLQYQRSVSDLGSAPVADRMEGSGERFPQQEPVMRPFVGIPAELQQAKQEAAKFIAVNDPFIALLAAYKAFEKTPGNAELKKHFFNVYKLFAEDRAADSTLTVRALDQKLFGILEAVNTFRLMDMTRGSWLKFKEGLSNEDLAMAVGFESITKNVDFESLEKRVVELRKLFNKHLGSPSAAPPPPAPARSASRIPAAN
jgi:hypothetical protein